VALNWPFPYPILPPARGATTGVSHQLSLTAPFFFFGGQVGITAGIGLESNVNFEPDNVASREILDRQTPNSEICFANGASAMVFDERVFVSLNPFNVYVAQPEVSTRVHEGDRARKSVARSLHTGP
jgi:hypothetical protein